MNPFDKLNLENDKIIFYSHLGLGDQIVCVGLVNFLSEKYSKIIVPCHDWNENMMSYIYKENPSVETVGGGNRGVRDHLIKKHFDMSLKDAIDKNLVIEAGYNKLSWPWNHSFYHANNFSYDISFDHFRLPESEEEDNELFDHLMSIYNISGDYAVVSDEYSKGKFDLDVKTDYPIVYIRQSENLRKNMFFLRKVLVEAKEVHLVNSGLFHFVERLPIKGNIHYYNARGKDFAFYKPENITSHP
jgi:hypothetical protein